MPGLGLSIPSGWDVTSLGDVTSKIGSGATPRGGSAVYVDDGPALIRSQNVHDNRFKNEGLVFLSEQAAAALKGVAVHEGDVLINITGDSILRTCLVPSRALPARVNQHVAIVRSNDRVDPGFLQKWLSQPLMKEFMLGHSSGGTRKAITKGHLQGFPLPLPPIEEQRGIAATFAALDDKIESTRRIRELLRSVGSARLAAAIANSPARKVPLEELTTSIARGVAPKYSDDDPGAPLVLNQKCVRDGWVTTAQARRMVYRDVAPQKRVSGGDVLVNSTGTGTLGRVGRWHVGSIFADSHVSIVKVDTTVADPTVVAYALFGREADIEALATGSTGQTELSPSRLAALIIELPDRELSAELELTLVALEDRIDVLRSEEKHLSDLRAALLPELLSGRIRVPEAQEMLA